MLYYTWLCYQLDYHSYMSGDEWLCGLFFNEKQYTKRRYKR